MMHDGYGVVVITAAQLHSTKPELRLYAGSHPVCSMSEIRDGENLNVFRWSAIPQNNSSPSSSLMPLQNL